MQELVLDFLNQIRDLSDLNNNQPFNISVEEDKNNKINFKQSIIDALIQSDAIKILNSFSGIIGIEGDELKKWNLDAYSHKIIINKDKFDVFYKGKKAELEDLAKCYYEKDVCIFNVNKKEIPFHDRVGAVLYFLYQSRLSSEHQDYNEFNDFLSEQHYYKKYRKIDSGQLRRAVNHINRVTKRDTKGYILNLISKKQISKNGKNLYKWDVKIK